MNTVTFPQHRNPAGTFCSLTWGTCWVTSCGSLMLYAAAIPQWEETIKACLQNHIPNPTILHMMHFPQLQRDSPDGNPTNSSFPHSAALHHLTSAQGSYIHHALLLAEFVHMHSAVTFNPFQMDSKLEIGLVMYLCVWQGGWWNWG